jgi:hypothetical protein
MPHIAPGVGQRLLHVGTLLDVAMPWLSPASRSVLKRLVAQKGYPGPAHQFALTVGMTSRFQLRRVLEREGLPALGELAAWVRVLIWVADWELSGTSLSRGALSEIRDPAVSYRTVERITGAAWSKVRVRGFDWVLLNMVARCQPGEGALGRNCSLHG